MGGHAPLGYDVRDRKLVVNDAEASLVRHIFQRFLQVGSATKLVQELNAAGHRTKRGKPFDKGVLYKLLHNRTYVGEVEHKGMAYPGQHEAIVDGHLGQGPRDPGGERASPRQPDARRDPGAAQRIDCPRCLDRLWETEWRTVLRVILLCLPNGVGFYLLFVYVVSYLQTLDGIAPREALDINTISMAGLIGCALAGGALSDRFGRKPVAVAAMVGLLILSWPLFDLFGHPRFAVMLSAQLCFAALIGLYVGQVPAMLTEALPREVRCTAVAVSYNLSVGMLGGLTPMIATWLIRRTGDEMVPATVLVVAAALTLLALWRTPETAGDPLR